MSFNIRRYLENPSSITGSANQDIFNVVYQKELY